MAVLQQTQLGVVLDLENLLHPARRTSGATVRDLFVEIVARLRDLGEIRHAVGCCDFWLARILAPVAGATGVRIYPGELGKDRADRELLRRAADIPASVEVLVIGSGDQAFAPLVAEQALAGRRTIVVARADSIAPALRAAAHEVIELAVPSLDPAATAA